MKQSFTPGYIFLLVLLMHTAGAEAQLRLIQGKVTDAITGAPVEYAYILNFSRQKQMYCNSRGEFRIDAGIGDTLVLYALGYDYKKVVIEPGMPAEETAAFKLTPQSHELSEARIIGFGSYSDFRDKLIHMDRPITKTEKLNNELADASRSAAMEAYAEAMAKQTMENGVTLMRAGIYTPEEIERMKLAKIKDQEKIRDQVYYKFNPMVVKEITGLTDDDDIINFMLFCKFSDEYLLNVNEYDLASRIALKYELFKKQKEDEKIMKNPVNQLDELLNILA